MSRKKICFPPKEYDMLKNLSEKINIPMAKVLVLLIMDAIECHEENEFCIRPKVKQKRNRDDYRFLNVTINDYINTYFEKRIKKTSYSFNEFAIDCINDYIDKNFKTIAESIVQPYSTAKRIHNSGECVRNGISMPMYSDKAKEEHPLESPVKKYIEKIVMKYGISEKALIQYYATKEINRILDQRESQKDIYQHPDEINFDF